jgi:hypothetical protein
MKYKYATHVLKGPAPDGRGRPYNPEKWIMGPDPLKRERYYALLKHRAQARFRGEEHSLTWEQWESIWDADTWAQRGRGSDDHCLVMVDPGLGWHRSNCEITTRRKHLQQKRQREQQNGR